MSERTCGCGCLRPVARGVFLPGHSLRFPVRQDYAVDDRGCWVWQRGVDCHGYGQVIRAGRSVRAHRVYFEEAHGWCPPTLDHLCRNRRCVNPAHLEPCSRGENVRRGDVAKLTWDDVTVIRESAAGLDCSQREAARRLAPLMGVAEQTVRQVIRGRRWPEADRPVVEARRG